MKASAGAQTCRYTGGKTKPLSEGALKILVGLRRNLVPTLPFWSAQPSGDPVSSRGKCP